MLLHDYFFTMNSSSLKVGLGLPFTGTVVNQFQWRAVALTCRCA